ncbi:MAG: bifunctional diaminohydroxyphosphoribosylaminopyrimidine deaminase/5-amino-6-(5-phosphoribosylamino)uracil reductase RibD [Opitutales bacterium]
MSVPSVEDVHFMDRALGLARCGWGATHPNPMVGAVLVCGGEVIAEGWHRADGQAHAEKAALSRLGGSAPPGTTMYVTLEPCSTEGRTGACTDAIREAGIERVVVGAVDPNPAHAGRGLDVLRQAGIEVRSGVCAEACEDLNLIFNHWIVQRTPLFAAKLAMTLDGKFAAASGHSRWVTSSLARADVMRWRRYFPAIGVSARTVLEDDPRLTSREGADEFCPRRIILDGRLQTVQAARQPKLFSDPFAARNILVCLESADAAVLEKARSLEGELWVLPQDGSHIDWMALRERCREAGLYGVYFEAGPGLATNVLERQLVDYCFVYQAAKFMADGAARGIGSSRRTKTMREALELHEVRHEVFENDHLTRGFLKK